MCQQHRSPDDRNGRRRTAITGLGVVSPLGNSVRQVWSALLGGQSGVRPLSRFDASSFPTTFGAEVMESPESFGPVDPEMRCLLNQKSLYGWSAAVGALVDARVSADAFRPSAIGVAIGSERRGDGYLERLASGKTPERTEHLRVSPFTLGTLLAAAYGFEGPQLTIGSACASSAQAIGIAHQKIVEGDALLMLAGGCDAIDPVMFTAFCRLGALSRRNDAPERASRPFDLHRDGFVISEGAAMLVLEDMEHARRRGARIYGELAGYASSANAYRVTDSPADGQGLYDVMQWALADADLTTESVDYINAHGTSTLQNDSSETAAIKRCFGERACSIPISSTKSMVGHMVNACGAFEAVVCLMSIVTGRVHPTVNYEHADPTCDLYYVPNVAVEVPVSVALSNSAGFGGVNASLVFQAV